MWSSPKNFKHNLFQMILILSCLISGFWWSLILAANPDEDDDEKDIFYIPTRSTPITFDGQIKDTEWQHANYFTFGYEGDPEIEFYGFWLNASQNDTLCLAIHIDDDSLQSEADQPDFLCLYFVHPDNITNHYWYQLTRSGDNMLYQNNSVGNWIPCSNCSTIIQTQIYSHKNYWEAEFKIPLKNPTFSETPFPMYLRVFNYYKETTDQENIKYIEYLWPPLGSIPPDSVHPFEKWANALLITDQDATRPDPFFSNRMKVLYTDKTNFGIEIIPGQENNIITKIDNHFFNDTAKVEGVNLQLQWSRFGVNTFSNIGQNVNLELLANIAKEVLYSWTPDPNINYDITIRAEADKLNDAITCNNSTRRDLKFIQITAGTKITSTALITNTETTASMSSGFASFQPVASEMLYFYIDRSELGSSIADSLWQGNLFPPEGDTLAPVGKDLFRLAFQPGESKNFNLKVTVPEITTAHPACEWVYKIIHLLIFKKMTMTVLAITPQNEQLEKSATEISQQNAFSNPVKPLLSKLRIQVTKEQDSFSVKGRIHHKMVVLGYFGFEMEILPTQWVIDWLRLLIIFVLPILLYWLIRFYVKKH